MDLRLSEFDYEIIHRAGEKVLHADAFSRNVGSVFYEENITEARIGEAQKIYTFCNTLNGNIEFYRSNNDLLYKIK